MTTSEHNPLECMNTDDPCPDDHKWVSTEGLMFMVSTGPDGLIYVLLSFHGIDIDSDGNKQEVLHIIIPDHGAVQLQKFLTEAIPTLTAGSN